MMCCSKRLGACHGDDIFYLVSSLPLVDMLPREEDRQVSRQLVSWLATFAKTGRPAEDWQPVAGDQDSSFWRIDTAVGMEERQDLVQRFCRWTEVHNREGR